MTSFDDRKKGYEEKFKHDQELAFKVTARRNKLLGQWAAQKLGLSGPAADDYAKQVEAADFEKPGDDDVVHKVLSDFKAKGLSIDANQIRHELQLLATEARKQLTQG